MREFHLHAHKALEALTNEVAWILSTTLRLDVINDINCSGRLDIINDIEAHLQPWTIRS
jgi:hypothetical protein